MQVAHQKRPQPLTMIQASAFMNYRDSIIQSEPITAQDPAAEINAFIAIRDELLAEAEEVPTCAKLDSVAVANDFIETCLRPSPVYQAQQLLMADAIHEEKRCQEVKDRIVELRARARSGARSAA
jgi:hypothetical protein